MLKIWIFPFLLLLIVSFSLHAANQCKHSIAKLISTEGRVEKLILNRSKWQPVSHHECFCQGDKIRTLPYSRVKLVFIRKPATILELEQNSTLTFPKIEESPFVPYRLFREDALFDS